MEQAAPKTYPNCWGCGQANGIGLKLTHRLEGDVLVTEFVPEEAHEGWPGITHGGIILGLLYELLENLPYHQGGTPMMKSVEARLRRPARVGARLTGRAWKAGGPGREIRVAAALYDEGEQIVAEATAVLVTLTGSQRRRIGIE